LGVGSAWDDSGLATEDSEPVNRWGAWRLAWDACANSEAMTSARKARESQWGRADRKAALSSAHSNFAFGESDWKRNDGFRLVLAGVGGRKFQLARDWRSVFVQDRHARDALSMPVCEDRRRLKFNHHFFGALSFVARWVLLSNMLVTHGPWPDLWCASQRPGFGHRDAGPVFRLGVTGTE